METARAAGRPPAEFYWHPHVTLERMRRPLDPEEMAGLRNLMAEAGEFLRIQGTTGWRVTEAVLMQSVREDGRTTYREIRREDPDDTGEETGENA